MLLYMTAHELRHLWQWEHPDKARQIRRLLKCDDETDADFLCGDDPEPVSQSVTFYHIPLYFRTAGTMSSREKGK